jgi:hypothetical protein
MKRCWLAVLPLAIAIVAWSWLPGGEHGARPPPMVLSRWLPLRSSRMTSTAAATLDQWRGTRD